LTHRGQTVSTLHTSIESLVLRNSAPDEISTCDMRHKVSKDPIALAKSPLLDYHAARGINEIRSCLHCLHLYVFVKEYATSYGHNFAFDNAEEW
jgi:hypothetical protein